MSSTVSQLFADPSTIREWTQEDQFAVPREEVEAAQLAALKERYEQLRPQIKLVDRLASDIEVDRIGRLGDITPLCLPHTTYKSYSPAHIERALRAHELLALPDALRRLTIHTQTIGIYPDELKAMIRDQCALRGGQRIVSLGFATSGNWPGPHDAIEPMRRMLRWIRDDHQETLTGSIHVSE
jgi:hypothetical protein